MFTDISRFRPMLALPALGGLLLLLLAAWTRGAADLNPDAVAYVRIAEYFASGRLDLAVSGYWSPMLSWVMVPLLGLLADPLLAARGAMVVSGCVFFLGGTALLRTLLADRPAFLHGVWLLALCAVAGSGPQITPDLLAGGLLCLGMAALLSERWPEQAGRQVGSGLALGASYLAKAAALPVSVLLVAVAALLWVGSRRVAPRQALRAAARAMAGLALIALPWIAVLSVHYGRPMFSSSGPINHAIVGPPDIARYHPTFETLHVPEAGRVTSWEDPTGMPYSYWSPVGSRRALLHQGKLIYKNANTVMKHLSGFDWLRLGVAAAVCGFVFHTPWPAPSRTDRWRWSAAALVCVSAVYLPVFADESRYFLAAYPLLLTASYGFLLSLADRVAPFGPWRVAAYGLVGLSFLLALGRPLRGAFNDPPDPSYTVARAVADALREAEVAGPIASVGEHAGDPIVGLYTAFLLRVPWHGHAYRPADADALASSGARVILVGADSSLNAALRDHLDFLPLVAIGRVEQPPPGAGPVCLYYHRTLRGADDATDRWQDARSPGLRASCPQAR